uniref:Outer capsid protein VP2 n=1 Tax=Bluetongue virus 9 TaxID=45032 RepID=K7NXL2_BTV|nr:outer capsid protein [Bluetongue virus 9]
MDEFGIPIYLSSSVPHDLLSDYDFMIDLSDKVVHAGDRHDPKKLKERKARDVPDGEVRTDLDYNPTDNEGNQLPRALDIALSARLTRKSVRNNDGLDFLTDDKWMEWMLSDAMDVQPLKIDLSARNGFVKCDIFNSSIYIRRKYADAIAYRYTSLEDESKGCNHTRVCMVNHLINNGLYNAVQECAYALKDTYVLRVHSQRERIDEPFEPGRPKVGSLGRNARIDMSDPGYSLFKGGMLQITVSGEIPNDIRVEMERLNQIRATWIRDKSSREVRAIELCTLLSKIGRVKWNAEEEPKDEGAMSLRFQNKIDSMFFSKNTEKTNIMQNTSGRTDEERFYALLLICATDAYSRRIWRSNPYPCLRGTLIAAECVLGDPYKTLRRKFNWSVRHAADKALENNAYIFTRINLFDTEKTPGMRVVHWTQELTMESQTTWDEGYPLRDEAPDDEMHCKIDTNKYKEMVTRVIDGGWDQENFKIHKLFHDDGNIFLMDFEKDAKLTAQSEVQYPDYYDKWIYAPIFDTKYKITETEIANAKNLDPAIKRTMDPMMDDPVMLQLNTIGNLYDTRPAVMGSTLSMRQRQTSLHKTLLDDPQNERFYSSRSIKKVDDPCPVYYTASLVLQKISELVMSLMTYHVDQDWESLKQYKHPSILSDFSSLVSNIQDISQLVVLLVDFFFERKSVLRSVEESRYIIHIIRSSDDANRLKSFELYFPRFGGILRTIKDAKEVSHVTALNFLPYFFLLGDNIIYKHKEWSVPVLIYSDGLMIWPAQVGANFNRFGFFGFLNYMRFHPGIRLRSKVLDDAEKVVAVEMLNYYMRTDIFKGGIQKNVRVTKLSQMEIYHSSLCGGLSGALIYALPISFPIKCLTLIIVGDDLAEPQHRISKVLEFFEHVRDHVRGIASISISRNGDVTTHSQGIVKVELLKKNILRHQFRVALLKVKGYVFGNDEMLTKLLNV